MMWQRMSWLLLLGCLLASRLSLAQYIPNSPKCVGGQYWCQDRCGSDAFGDTCCQTPTDGVYNMCGLGTTCCMYGCCPSGSTCNDVGACIETITTTNSAGQTTTTTSTIVPAQTSLPGSAPTSTPSTVKPVTTVITTSDITITVTIPTILTTPLVETTEGVTLTFEPPPPPPPPSTQPTTAIVSGTPVVIVGTYTIPEPPHVTNPTTITTDGVTITFEPSPPPSVQPTTTTISGTPVIIVGPYTIPEPPHVTNPTTVITDGVTITFEPSPPPSVQPTTTTISGTPVVIVGPYTIPEPPHVTNPTTVITDGVTITFEPSPPPSVQPTTTTISGTPVIIVGPYTIPEPPHVTNPTTITTDGVTMTFEPPSPSAQPTTTTVSGTPVVIIGPYTIPEPAHITTPTTVTTDGVTLTFEPPSTTSTPSSKSGATTSSTGTVLPTFSTWPPFTIIPVTTTVSGPQPTSTGTVVPCDLWFFDICLVWSSLHVSIFGWYIPLPAGIYPPGPPPDMKFPPGISIEGTLPPWPEITIGNDHLPTYSSEPTSCQTETATLCGTTTSYAVSTSGTVTSTTSSQIASTCQTVAGCSVSDENTSAKTTASATCSSTSTVTDVWVSCATGATSAPGSCTTTSTSLVSGCGVTASTMMCTRTTTITGTATGTALPGPNNDVCTVYTTETYVVYPMDSTDSSQTAAIASLLGTMATAADIFTLTATGIGIIYWQLPLSPDQASSLAQNSNVRSVFIPCLDSCYDPSIELVMQSNSPDTLVFVDQFGTGPSSPNNNPLRWYRSNYVFDDSAGSGIPVYMIDSGVDTTHPEFTTGFTEGPLNGAGPVNDRLRFITVGSTLGTTPGTDIRGHGTSMMSQITGWSLGISKLVEPICVQMDILGGATQFIKALNAVLDDVDQKGYQQAVLSMSIFYPDYIFNAGTDYAGTAVQVALLLKALVAKGVLPVAGSGNDGKSTIAGVPAGLGANNPPELNLGALTYVPEMLVVGGVNSAGALYPRTNTYAQFGLPHIYAPGDSVRTAWKPYRSSSGTSIATAQTAGLAAYLLGLAKANGPNHLSEDISTPAKLKSYMMELSWERVAGYPAIYNGLSPVDAGSLLTGPSCPLVQRDIPEGELPSMAPCPTTNTTSTVSTTSASTFATSTITNTSLPPLPRLSTTSTPPITTVQPIVTSPGSSCASTTTTTLCEVPQEPCFPSAVCQSWVATTTTSVAPPTTTSAAPSPTASWILSIYNAACSDMNSNADFDYYTLEGFETQELNEQCIPLQGALPLISDTTASCEWFTNGGLTSAKSCSSGTFTSPTSFNIHNGFCTIYADANCSGESNGIDSSLYTGCTDITSDLFMPSTWGSMQCFAYRA